METVYDIHFANADFTLKKTFGNYKYWFRNGPSMYNAKYNPDSKDDYDDWRGSIQPFCSYIPAKNIGILSDPASDELIVIPKRIL